MSHVSLQNHVPNCWRLKSYNPVYMFSRFRKKTKTGWRSVGFPLQYSWYVNFIKSGLMTIRREKKHGTRPWHIWGAQNHVPNLIVTSDPPPQNRRIAFLGMRREPQEDHASCHDENNTCNQKTPTFIIIIFIITIITIIITTTITIITIIILLVTIHRRRFRSQTSDTMDTSMGKVSEKNKKKRTSKKSKGQKNQRRCRCAKRYSRETLCYSSVLWLWRVEK